jgi:penicillin-binding protein 1B
VGLRAKFPRGAALSRFLLHPVGRVLLALTAVGITIGASFFLYHYLKYARLIEEKLSAGPFRNTSLVYSAPRVVSLNDEASPEEIIVALRRSGYSESKATRIGSYTLRNGSVEIYPGPDSYFKQEEVIVKFREGKIAQIVSLRDNTERTQHALEPELITSLFDAKREKRRLVRFHDIPQILVHAVISAEDKRFFQHAGFDPLRIMKSAYVDIRSGYRAQGASTLSMQVARMFWLTQEKTFQRKAAEVLITMELERKLSKEQIFEYYANEIDLGRRGSFAIRGFAEAAVAYFGKDLSQLSVAEAATLAGLIQRPSATNPYRWPERATNRRNIILSMMRDNGYVNDRDYGVAVATPMQVSRSGVESTDAPYFIDIVNDDLTDRFQEHDFQNKSYRVYTTINMNLQHAAAEAVRESLKEVDERLARRFKGYGKTIPQAQLALVALDAQTGEVKALVGGRNYGTSQLNRALAKRQPGSSFKPFVFAAALNTALDDSGQAITPLTLIQDEPTTFWFDGRPYEPRNYHGAFYGNVTLRQALAKSMNIPTVKLAEMVGYQNVVNLAKRAGLNMNIHATPSVALGAYEVTPIEIAGAYTAFSNHGIAMKPSFIRSIRSNTGEVIHEAQQVGRPALDPRVAYLVTSLMEEVLRSGTGAGVRGRGFTLPAAGKTGSSHDGWFAGFTSKLICVVWVGFDDNRDIELEGAHVALPIWAEFMKRAHQFREYSGVRAFTAPDGILSVEVDTLSGQLATSSCPKTRSEMFIAGSQPVEPCRLHSGGVTHVAGWDTPEPDEPTQRASATARPVVSNATPPVAQVNGAAAKVTPPAAAEPAKRKGFFGKIKDMFK